MCERRSKPPVICRGPDGGSFRRWESATPMIEVHGRPQYLDEGSFMSSESAAAVGRDETTRRRHHDAISSDKGPGPEID